MYEKRFATPGILHQDVLDGGILEHAEIRPKNCTIEKDDFSHFII